MKTPVCVVRLPRGPDPHGRGFDPTSPRYLALCPSSLSTSGEADPVALRTEQRTRAMMRERFLRCLISMANKKIQFLMYEKGCTPSQRTCVGTCLILPLHGDGHQWRGDSSPSRPRQGMTEAAVTSEASSDSIRTPSRTTNVNLINTGSAASANSSSQLLRFTVGHLRWRLGVFGSTQACKSPHCVPGHVSVTH
ncbi:gem-associated protein 7 isoform X1 [Gadus macrocephalus]|uniref:gem-associated protein 7 isoform X1 n=1 Tax=Gadus macrocephalus TaxID=80720 RepID=UPI0028CB3EF5|nr:gem-associated protein 7 isoform X1 [Gadus macrocephalus]